MIAKYCDSSAKPWRCCYPTGFERQHRQAGLDFVDHVEPIGLGLPCNIKQEGATQRTLVVIRQLLRQATAVTSCEPTGRLCLHLGLHLLSANSCHQHLIPHTAHRRRKCAGSRQVSLLGINLALGTGLHSLTGAPGYQSTGLQNKSLKSLWLTGHT